MPQTPTKAQGKPPFTTSALLDGTAHGFFGRQGGVSTGLYGSLNCGPGSADAAGNVATNRARVAAALGRDPNHLYTVHQTHSADCVILDGTENPETRPQADALATDQPGILIGILTADCTPVLFHDPVAQVIGAAHAGWRGATGGILDSTINAMETLGAQRFQIRAAIGPTIGPDDYEVGEDFVDAATKADPAAATFVIRHSDRPRPHFDLPGYVAARLQGLGVQAIDSSTGCSTYADQDRYFSYRYNCHQGARDYGRMIAVIGLPTS